jgi:hypothetical protein
MIANVRIKINYHMLTVNMIAVRNNVEIKANIMNHSRTQTY